ncbi:MAG: HipA N-terminal domain-containing protein [Candidatus Marinimicrobia bacterium]|nr:HipA N-terminal domain-containing protein [Candidatus Neomarinimicrobiota bacterium]
MRSAKIFLHGEFTGVLEEIEYGKRYRFIYSDDYSGDAISHTMPVEKREFEFNRFPPFFDGLLPEGVMLEGLLRQGKIDRNDLFGQLIAVGQELVGAVTVEMVL